MKEKTENMEPDKRSGLGELLRSEREKKGLSRDQVANVTRLRKHYVDALENENWEILPSPVFVKGFIRSYAQAVGFDGKEAIEMFESIAPVEEQIPKPLIGPKESKRWAVYLLIPFIAVMAFFIYLYTGYDTPPPKDGSGIPGPSAKMDEKAALPAGTDTSPKATAGAESPEATAGAESSEKVQPSPEMTAEAEIPEEPAPPPEMIAETETPEEAPPAAETIPGAQDTEREATRVEPAEDVETGEEAVASLPDQGTGQETESIGETGSGAVGGDEATDQRNEGSTANYNFVLTGIVKMRTYVKIYVDDNPPKEYIFQPGSQPQWTAEKGFNIVLGNAAGMEFDVNGKRMGDFGKLGKVVRLNIPEDFKSSLYED